MTTGPRPSRPRDHPLPCAEPGAETFVDLVGATVEAVIFNGVDLDPAEYYADSRIAPPGAGRRQRARRRADGRYTHTGEGLHRFVDPVDDEVYLYSQFEVADARRVFAVFEQPDLKARFTFTVTAPGDWQVVSNSPRPSPSRPRRRRRRTWRFAADRRGSRATSPPSSPGPTTRARRACTSGDGEMPLGLFCRGSLAPHLDADDIFDLTKHGFAFFEEEFDSLPVRRSTTSSSCPSSTPAPWRTPAASRSARTTSSAARSPRPLVERRAMTILHELAHMWFGDLVTMRWWDDLWLNESFADGRRPRCQAEATAVHRRLDDVRTAEKAWAYRQDQLPSTHPIVADDPRPRGRRVNFDGITYAKGASVLKQLVA